MTTECYPTVSLDEGVQLAYESMRAQGQTHNMAEMLATRSLPGLRTDATLMANAPKRQPLPREHYAKAKAAGVVTDGKFYDHQAARFPGDPEAWISGYGDYKRICKKNQWGLSGDVKNDIKPKEVAAKVDTQPYTVADDLVHEEVTRMGQEDPSLVSSPKALKRTTEAVRKRVSGNQET